MKHLSVNFENCYGIKKLNHVFNFESKTFVVYSANGVMKTSFAKTFNDIAEAKETKDLIFLNRKTERKAIDENNTPLQSENICVIEPYNETYKSEKISTLLVNAKLKNQYEKIHIEINNKKEILLSELKTVSGLRTNIEETISETFTSISDGFFKALSRITEEVLDDSPPAFEGIIYKKIFNDKVELFLKNDEFRSNLQEYMNKYNTLIDDSTYFKKGVFNHNNASVIAKSLKDNGFFKANHSLSLNSTEKNEHIASEKELEGIIEKEKQTILNDEELLKKFNTIDQKLKANKELRDFREYLIQNMIILPELLNIDGFRENLWISYIKTKKDLFNDLSEEYKKGKKEIALIIEQAKKEKTQWEEVIEIFNQRFSIPFKVSIQNQDQVILKEKAPMLKFEFIDNKDSRTVNEKELLSALSTGEKRALYLLNIIFEVEARKRTETETLFIIDDIADSFDYKNKYAIIEYLKDISKFDIFKQIILSHNYDFFRTISSRLDIPRENKLNTERANESIILIEEKYQKNPFNHWKNNFENQISMLIASIPFLRNLAEYSNDKQTFLKLTSLLHYKPDSQQMKISDLEILIKVILKDKDSIKLQNPDHYIFDTIFDTADKICTDNSDTLDLENKIVLAIGIRLKAEIFIVKKINNTPFWESISKNQSFVLYEKFQEQFPTDTVRINLLEQVNLMTPENIHLNSFMYEPILDMSNHHLKSLYKNINQL